MSVLIRGMKKPDNCEVCPYAFCHLDTNNCPIIELHDHGDLIDRDALIKGLRDYACKPCKEYGADKNGDRCAWCSFDDAFARIEKAKKVIPAERNEDPSHPFADSVMIGER